MSEYEKPMYQGIIDNISRIFGPLNDFKIPKLVFSDETPQTKCYGELDGRRIFNRLQRLRAKYLDEHPDEENFICALTGDNAKGYLIDWMFSPGMREFDMPWKRRFGKEVRGVLSREKHTLTITAQYESKNNRIVVFRKAFEQYSPTEREANIRQIVAHEMFHALHYYFAPDTYHEWSYESEIVREALADFYAYALCLDDCAYALDGVNGSDSEKAARERCRFWEKNLFANIPYPNAIFCMYRNDHMDYDGTFDDCRRNGSIDKLLEILDMSKKDMKLAYLELVPIEFRKRPTREYLEALRNRSARLINDIGFSKLDDNASMWSVIKKIIEDKKIGSLEELQAFIPSDCFVVRRGRFIHLESGEILSAYPQWEILDSKKFVDFAVEQGCVKKLTVNGEIARRITEELDGENGIIIVKVRMNNGHIYTYRFVSDENDSINVGDEVKCFNKNGGLSKGIVVDIDYVNEEQYRAICNDIGYDELSTAEKATVDVVRLNRFRYHSGGGFICIRTDSRTYYVEINRDTCTVEMYKQKDGAFGAQGEKEEVESYPVTREVTEAFFRELERANWQDSPFLATACMDCLMWYVDIGYSDGALYGCTGAGSDGPRNHKEIQDRYNDVMKDAGLSKRELFGYFDD